MRRRLWMQIYVGFVAMLLMMMVMVGASVHLLRGDVGPVPPPLLAAAELFLEGLPEGPALDDALAERADRLQIDVALWQADGTPIADTGAGVGTPPTGGASHGWIPSRARGGMFLTLSDGRLMAVTFTKDHFNFPLRRFFGMLALVALALACASIPVARRVTRRLETLRSGVEQLGRGDLSARVEVRGCDEVAELAAAFNGSAERIEELVGYQRRMLASASHELRSPLARLRMAIELLGEDLPDGRAGWFDGAVSDIAELDELVEDLLTSVRLEAGGTVAERVDLVALLRDEAERTGATLTAAADVHLQGDPRMLRVLFRNLLENARRHAGGADVEAVVEPGRVVVSDRGPGVPEAERERIFEPFYRPAGHREGEGGVGLGLALARQVARRHGGDVVHEPRDGGGSRFVVTLPGRPAP